MCKCVCIGILSVTPLAAASLSSTLLTRGFSISKLYMASVTYRKLMANIYRAKAATHGSSFDGIRFSGYLKATSRLKAALECLSEFLLDAYARKAEYKRAWPGNATRTQSFKR